MKMFNFKRDSVSRIRYFVVSLLMIFWGQMALAKGEAGKMKVSHVEMRVDDAGTILVLPEPQISESSQTCLNINSVEISPIFQIFYKCGVSPVEIRKIENRKMDTAFLSTVYKQDSGSEDNPDFNSSTFRWGTVSSHCTPSSGSTCYYYLMIKRSGYLLSIKANSQYRFEFERVVIKRK